MCISAKTTLRERCKQADLEAVALKYVHRRAKSHLVNISEPENSKLQQKIENGDVMGLDVFMRGLSKRPFMIAPEVRVIQSDTVITREAVRRFSKK